MYLEQSYIERAGNTHTYFDLGDKWNEIKKLVNESDDEMWRINKQFIDDQKALGKEFYFSHEPWKAQSLLPHESFVRYSLNQNLFAISYLSRNLIIKILRYFSLILLKLSFNNLFE